MAIYQMEFQASGRTLEFDTDKHANLSILDVATDAGLGIRAGCRNGYCKTCCTKKLSGELEYFAGDPMDVEEDECLLCSCVPKSDVVFDA